MNATEGETPPPTRDIGGTDPTPTKVATARRLLDLHREIDTPVHNFCGWCLKPWPCTDVRWSTVVIERAGRIDP